MMFMFFTGHVRSYSSSSDSTTEPESGTQTLRQNLAVRRNSITDTEPVVMRRARITSAPPLREMRAPKQPAIETPSPLLQRRRSFTALRHSYPSKGEMLKDIFTAFPAPQPQAISKKAARPSSAVSLRAGKIPNLRKTNAWV